MCKNTIQRTATPSIILPAFWSAPNSGWMYLKHLHQEASSSTPNCSQMSGVFTLSLRVSPDNLRRRLIATACSCVVILFRHYPKLVTSFLKMRTTASKGTVPDIQATLTSHVSNSNIRRTISSSIYPPSLFLKSIFH